MVQHSAPSAVQATQSTSVIIIITFIPINKRHHYHHHHHEDQAQCADCSPLRVSVAGWPMVSWSLTITWCKDVSIESKMHKFCPSTEKSGKWWWLAICRWFHWWLFKCIRVGPVGNKNTNTQIRNFRRKYTNTQQINTQTHKKLMHKYTNTQIHKYADDLTDDCLNACA